MKYYLVDETGNPSNKVVIGLSYEPEEHYGEVSNVDPKDRPYLKTQLVDGVEEIYIDTAAQTIEQDKRLKAENRRTVLENRDRDTDLDVSRVFNTRVGSEVLMKSAMWRSMLDNPGAFSSLGLKSSRILRNADTSILFAKGAALNTNAKINAYATRKLEQASEHWAFRAQRQQQYKNEIEVINNS